MQTPKQRVEFELSELQTKIKNLEAFMQGQMFNTLGTTQQMLLRSQYFTMKNYETALELRLQNW